MSDPKPKGHIPEPTTIEVRVDQVLMPERADDGWQYSLGDNAIVFDGRAIPRPGMEVDVAYELSEGTLFEEDE